MSQSRRSANVLSTSRQIASRKQRKRLKKNTGKIRTNMSWNHMIPFLSKPKRATGPSPRTAPLGLMKAGQIIATQYPTLRGCAGRIGDNMYNVYEVKTETTDKWFFTCLGDDKFTAEVLFSHLYADWMNGHHLTDLILVEE